MTVESFGGARSGFGAGASRSGAFRFHRRISILLVLEMSFFFLALSANVNVNVNAFTLHHQSNQKRAELSLPLSCSQPEVFVAAKSFFTPISTTSSSSSAISARTRIHQSTLPFQKCPFAVSLTPLVAPSSSSSSSLYYKNKEDINADDQEVAINASMEDLTLPTTATTTKSIVQASRSDTTIRTTTKSTSIINNRTSSSTRSKRVLKSSPIQNLVTIESLKEFTDCIHKNRDKVVVVRFFASWCKTCKQSEPSFYRFVRRNPNIVFVNIPFSKNKKLFQVLHISAVPYGQMYYGEELVEEMKLGPKNFSHFEKAVQNYYASIVPPT